MKSNSSFIAALLLGAGLVFHAGLGMSHDQPAQNEAAPDAAASTEWTSGEVRKIDKAKGKVTIKHGWVRKLDMPPMVMGYHVKDMAMLDQLQPGDKIKFDADRVDGEFTVMRFEKVE